MPKGEITLPMVGFEPVIFQLWTVSQLVEPDTSPNRTIKIKYIDVSCICAHTYLIKYFKYVKHLLPVQSSERPHSYYALVLMIKLHI